MNDISGSELPGAPNMDYRLFIVGAFAVLLMVAVIGSPRCSDGDAPAPPLDPAAEARIETRRGTAADFAACLAGLAGRSFATEAELVAGQCSCDPAAERFVAAVRAEGGTAVQVVEAYAFADRLRAACADGALMDDLRAADR